MPFADENQRSKKESGPFQLWGLSKKKYLSYGNIIPALRRLLPGRLLVWQGPWQRPGRPKRP